MSLFYFGLLEYRPLGAVAARCLLINFTGFTVQILSTVFIHCICAGEIKP
jgi:hypothetical protein